MAILTVQNASNGAAVTLAAAAVGDQIPGGSRAAGWGIGVALVVSNASVSAIDVTVTGHTTINVPSNGHAVIPVFATQFGTIRDITYSATTSVTVAAVKVSGD